MSLVLRSPAPSDAAPCGRICYDAFRAVADRHGFPPDFPSPDAAVTIVARLIAHPAVHGVVAERDGRIVGSNFLDLRGTVGGVGPITVDPAAQDRAVGRRLMDHVLAHAAARGTEAVRLVQAGYHVRSLSLYAKLGFVVREPLANLQGPPLGVVPPGRRVRAAAPADVDACDALCRRAHGHDRGVELREAVDHGMTTVVEHAGRITGYATAVAFFGHAVGESNADLQALIAAAPAFGWPGFLVPTRNAELFAWCLAHGLRVVQPLTLMTRGPYREPALPSLPSVVY